MKTHSPTQPSAAYCIDAVGFVPNHLRNPAPMHYAPHSFKEMEVLEKSASWQRAARSFKVDDLNVQVFNSLDDLANDAAFEVNKFLRTTLREKGSAAAILATGNSQIQFLKRLVALEGIDWSKITLFHMDEYMGIDAHHQASFRKYMRERVQTLVQPKAFHFLEGDADLPLDECARYESLLKAQSIDLCCLGIGEKGCPPTQTRRN